MAECNEAIVEEMCKEIFGKYVDTKLCEELVRVYDLAVGSLYRLRDAWGKFPKEKISGAKGWCLGDS